ncbi:MAG: hypothetical protein FJY97_17360 [candidate division Zixibacteria bacterium]|nr:hypothetical protein [candidate division Zixibacteria bacterium]
MAATTVDDLYEQTIKSWPTSDRLRLIEKIVHDLSINATAEHDRSHIDWMSLRGVAPHLLAGEDAQTWVSQTRQEADSRHAHTDRPPP